MSFILIDTCQEERSTNNLNFCLVDTAKKGLMWTSIWQILAKKKGLEWASFQRLGEVQKALNLSLPQAVDLVSHTLHKEPYTRAKVCQILEMKEEDFVNKVLSAKTAQGKGVMSQIPDLSQEVNWLLTNFCSIIKHWRLRVLYHLEVYENRSCVLQLQCRLSSYFNEPPMFSRRLGESYLSNVSVMRPILKLRKNWGHWWTRAIGAVGTCMSAAAPS